MNALYFLVFHQNIRKDKKTKTNLKYAQHIFETTQNCGSNENTMSTLHITIKGDTHEYSREFYVIDIRKKGKQLNNSHRISLNASFTKLTQPDIKRFTIE